MGVDYNSHFGIGVNLNPDFVSDKEDVWEFLEDSLEGSPYRFFDVGSGAYTGEKNVFCIVIDSPFKDGTDNVANKIYELERFLELKNILFDGNVDVVGGLQIS